MMTSSPFLLLLVCHILSGFEASTEISLPRERMFFAQSFARPAELAPDYFMSPLPAAAFRNLRLIEQLKDCTMDMCLAVDASYSLTERESNGKTGWENEIIFSTNLVRRISSFGKDVSVRYANVVFGQNVRTWFDFTENQNVDHIIGKLETMPYLSGQTNIPDAMIECQNLLLGSGRNVDKVALVLTDGVSSKGLGALTVAEAANSLESHGINTIAVGAGNINETELLVIAQGDPSAVFIAEDTSSLNKLVDDIGISSCAKKNDTTTTTSTTTTTTTPPGPCQWSDWSPCDIPCGGGVQTRTMIDCCDKCLARLDVRSCNTDPCPYNVDGQWGDWSAYGACTDSCGGGYQIRSRTCSNPSQAGAGTPCVGPASEINKCNTQDCPINGQWGEWCCIWSECSTTCGGGQRTRTRQCSNPAPANGGADCVGSSIEEEMCNSQPCPIDGGWSSWSEWGGCNALGCFQTRTRTCTEPPPQHGGKDCLGFATDYKSCKSYCCLGSYMPSSWFRC
ncbi:SCO-spondin [Lingula anatina]|uniref:SCO-spondin n=1 Tax=Lingula anatina TaxID=7574 RepID=A0A1S3JW51_LINAN|nr:SCO-spondin [Lingula anatina]|eukprot:XP_013414532.1 SCO-spondin [Lingula anatina]